MKEEKFARTSNPFTDILREAGIKITPQRTEIFRILAQSKDHPDAETIFNRVRAHLTAISFDTVYRTLSTFEKTGLVGKLRFLSSRSCYDPQMKPHQHFICSSCGLVHDIYISDRLGTLSEEVEEIAAVNSVHVEIWGICSRCRNNDR